jgi:CRP-like cAMP-binding protein
MFSDCDSVTIDKIVDAMKYERFQPGDVLCEQGDRADRFYVIVMGQCGVTVVREDIVKLAKPGGAAAKTEGIPALGFHRYTKKERTQAKAKQEEKARNEARVRSGLVDGEKSKRDRLAKQLQALNHSGKVVPRPAETRKKDTVRVGTLKALEVFGESALLPAGADNAKTRAATVTAEGDVAVQVLSISSKGFNELVDTGLLDGTQILKRLKAEATKREVLTRTRSRRARDNSQFVMVKCDLCDKWRHVEEQIDGSFTCGDIGERCATGVML